jgi:3'-phosphoadenosine 5'-phosphosulfate (PAPS) 3'-phosphatase
VPSPRAPDWRSWDLAAAAALANANGLILQDLDGCKIDLENPSARKESAWVCARDESVLSRVLHQFT